MLDVHGSTAVVTGASSGIGAEFAEQLARRGADLVLVARREDRLRALAARLAAEHGVGVRVVAADLAGPAGRQTLLDALAGTDVDVLINNAGFATHGAFAELDPQRVHDEIAVNVVAVTMLTRALLPGMLARDRGAIVNIASTAAFQPIAHMAVYGATKAFVLSFTEALWGETERGGVDVVAVCPGATDTEFFDVAGESASVGSRQTPAQVVETALGALDRRSTPPSVVSGAANRWASRLPRILPRRTTIRVTRNLVAPK
ncbi:SDR family oxidoreductase [Gordonia sp. PP30]|uniref:SDR family NAD(P)-dependent oxidoreductase n=1 Tax=Gordonia sp. PP30 TaxID=2935861 RepID=UPI001FFF3B3E|nr:SDR family oxidoreductase [Gordonia sp. PP30]UQE73711.1 SDR family oxidoreductase [Gordonia sp. PP30]